MAEGAPNKKKWIPSAAAIRWQKAKHRQELEIELIRLLQRDPEMKYWIGIAAGAGLAGLTALITQYIPDIAPPADPDASKRAEWERKKAELDKAFCGWMVIAGGPGAVLAANPALLNAMNPLGGDTNTPWGALNSAIGMAGVSFAGFCASYLLLKAVFGEQGIRKLTGAINDIVPG